VQHVYGDARCPDLMLLPGETIGEPYRDMHQVRKMKEDLMKQIGPFQAAKRLVIYGHSLSPIEAELRNALWAFFADHWCPEIWVVASSVSEAFRIGTRLRPMPPKGRDWTITPMRGER
jgi:hypothetical protein